MLDFNKDITGSMFCVKSGTEASITFPVNENFHISLNFDDSCGEGEVTGDDWVKTNFIRSYLKIYKKYIDEKWVNVTEECFGEQEIHNITMEKFTEAIAFCKNKGEM
jgi:hypothetical protein